MISASQYPNAVYNNQGQGYSTHTQSSPNQTSQQQAYISNRKDKTIKIRIMDKPAMVNLRVMPHHPDTAHLKMLALLANQQVPPSLPAVKQVLIPRRQEKALISVNSKRAVNTASKSSLLPQHQDVLASSKGVFFYQTFHHSKYVLFILSHFSHNHGMEPACHTYIRNIGCPNLWEKGANADEKNVDLRRSYFNGTRSINNSMRFQRGSHLVAVQQA